MRTGFILAMLIPAVVVGAEPIRLFNGTDLAGWKGIVDDPNADPAKTWFVRDGLLLCHGKPKGYLRTEREDFENYRLSVEWRWPEGTPEKANNGVLVHVSKPGALNVWPKCLEVQLAAGNAGDFWVIPGADSPDATTIDVPFEGVPGEERVLGRRHLNFTEASEKPRGEWNEMEILCRENTVAVKVNGDIANYAFNSNVSRGAIAIQSEGAPAEFRKVELTPLE